MLKLKHKYESLQQNTFSWGKMFICSYILCWLSLGLFCREEGSLSKVRAEETVPKTRVCVFLLFPVFLFSSPVMWRFTKFPLGLSLWSLRGKSKETWILLAETEPGSRLIRCAAGPAGHSLRRRQWGTRFPAPSPAQFFPIFEELLTLGWYKEDFYHMPF